MTEKSTSSDNGAAASTAPAKPQHKLAPARIVCAANLYACGTVVTSARHHDALMNKTAKALGLKGTPREQGFIDQFGNFLSRCDAWVIAEAQGQIRRRVGGDSTNGGTLYSENLY